MCIYTYILMHMMYSACSLYVYMYTYKCMECIYPCYPKTFRRRSADAAHELDAAAAPEEGRQGQAAAKAQGDTESVGGFSLEPKSPDFVSVLKGY